MDIVARLAIGADQAGVDEIYVVKDPFRISTTALEWLNLRAEVHVLEIKYRHDETDTVQAIEAMLQQGVAAVAALGGDGTHRVIARTAPDTTLIALSTGTNNVFPIQVEPTIAGLVVGFAAEGLIADDRLKPRCKVLHIDCSTGSEDVALIDVVVLKDDFIGNLRPYDPEKIEQLVMTTALPDAIGMSPIGGLVSPVEKNDPYGLHVQAGHGTALRAPIAPGYFREVNIRSATQIRYEQPIEVSGACILALDGDRMHRLNVGDRAVVRMRRDGPYMLDVPNIMRAMARTGKLPTYLNSEPAD